MTIRNPIDQRHANGCGLACSVFWRRIGGKFAIFLAAYPWLVTAAIFAEDHVRWILMSWQGRTPFGATLPPVFDNLLEPGWILAIAQAMILAVYISAIFLFPAGLIWCERMWGAWRKGFASGRLWLGCTILGFGGFLVLAALIVPVALLLLLLAGAAWSGMMMLAWWKGWLSLAWAIFLFSGPAWAFIFVLLFT